MIGHVVELGKKRSGGVREGGFFFFEAAEDGKSGGQSQERTDCGMHDLPALQ